MWEKLFGTQLINFLIIVASHTSSTTQLKSHSLAYAMLFHWRPETFPSQNSQDAFT